MKTIIGGIAVILLGVGMYLYVSRDHTSENTQSFDGRNSSFVIDGERATLVNGTVEREAAPGSASKITTRYFGNEAKGDLTFDGKEDVAFLISQNTGGTGEFYYVVVAVATTTGYATTNAFLIGDRIAPQSTEIHSDPGELRVNYADRKPGESMTAQPTQGKVLLLKVSADGKLEGLMN